MESLEARLDALQQQLDKVQHRLDQAERQQREALDNQANALQVMSRENTARDWNRIIAYDNSPVMRPAGALKPLYSLLSGRLIDNFPRLMGDVQSLAPAEVDRLLKELKLDMDGPGHGHVEERRRTLLLACGVRYIAV